MPVEIDLTDEIVKSEAGRRMLSMVSPIYRRSYVGLWMFELLGRSVDEMRAWVESMKQQIAPGTATWSLPYWEEQYGIKIDESIPDARRRAMLLSRTKSRGAFTPGKLKALSEAITGVSARVVERVSPHSFAVYLPFHTDRDARLAEEIRRVKPAHMTFELRYEEGAFARAYVGISARTGIQITIRQAN